MKVCSIFSQVLKLFSRGEFEKAVKAHKAEKHARGFTSWGQFLAMLFCQLGQAHSLHEICGGLACCKRQLKHLGVPVAPRKSTLRLEILGTFLRNGPRLIAVPAIIKSVRSPPLDDALTEELLAGIAPV